MLVGSSCSDPFPGSESAVFTAAVYCFHVIDETAQIAHHFRMSRLSVLLWLTVCLPIYSQSNLAALNGRVDDPQNKPLSGAQVHLKSRTTGAARSAISNNEGLFELASVPPGDYDLQVTAAGFAARPSLYAWRSASKCTSSCLWHSVSAPKPLQLRPLRNCSRRIRQLWARWLKPGLFASCRSTGAC